MKKEKNESKKMILFFIIFSSLIGMYIIYGVIRNNKLENESFKYYNYYNFSENYDKVSKSSLIQDPFLTSLLRIDNYNGKIDKENFETIIKYYLLNITKNYSEKIKNRSETLNFCMSKKSFIKSFKEFFDYDISSFELLKNIDYITYTERIVCFNISDEILFDYYTLIGVESIQSNNGIITAKIYLYDLETDTTEEEKNIKNKLLMSINNGNLKSFNSSVENYEEKHITFKELPKGDFFKYQILSVLTK